MNKIMMACLVVYLAGGLQQGNAQDSKVEPFLGSWALNLDYPDNSAGWLEIRQEGGYLDADILWRWASVYPVDFVFMLDDYLVITRSSEKVTATDAAGKATRKQRPLYWYDIYPDGKDRIKGLAHFPSRDGLGMQKVSFTGNRIPPCGSAPDLAKAEYGKAVELFNGKNLKGWEIMGSAANGWKVEGGVLINDPVQIEDGKKIAYGNLRTVDTFEDFSLSLEVNVPAGSNSGVYLRGIYEVQVLDSYGREPDSHNMGGLYSRITPSATAEKPAGEWQQLEMILYKRHLTVVLNGTTIIDNQCVKGVTGGALTSDEFSPGPIYLQGDHGPVSYRNMVLKPITN
jgi:hypothetical protein